MTHTIEELLFAKLLATFFEKIIVLVGTIFYVFQPFSYFYIGISLSVFYLFVEDSWLHLPVYKFLFS